MKQRAPERGGYKGGIRWEISYEVILTNWQYAKKNITSYHIPAPSKGCQFNTKRLRDGELTPWNGTIWHPFWRCWYTLLRGCNMIPSSLTKKTRRRYIGRVVEAHLQAPTDKRLKKPPCLQQATKRPMSSHFKCFQINKNIMSCFTKPASKAFCRRAIFDLNSMICRYSKHGSQSIWEWDKSEGAKVIPPSIHCYNGIKAKPRGGGGGDFVGWFFNSNGKMALYIVICKLYVNWRNNKVISWNITHIHNIDTNIMWNINKYWSPKH